MYRTSDPRFRRRIHDLSATVETATESAQSGLYIFGHQYVKPCFESVASCFTSCVDASCPALNYSQRRDRLRRSRGGRGGRGTGRGADLGFEFYDDWDDMDESDNLLGWGGSDEFDRLLPPSGGASAGGYGAVTSQQPGRQRGMSYPKARRKSVEPDPTLISNSKGFLARLFGGGGKALRYKPSAADLQEHPGARRRDMTEGEALLSESEGDIAGVGRRHRRACSGTATSGETTDSLSSRGDIFPSDEELEDAIPLDDEFAMVLERRNTASGPGSIESGSNKTGGKERKGKRPSAGSRTSTRRTFSSRSTPSSKKTRSRRNSSEPQTPNLEVEPELSTQQEAKVPTMSELNEQEATLAQKEEAEVQRKREEAHQLAVERGLPSGTSDELPSKEGTPRTASVASVSEHQRETDSRSKQATVTTEEPGQLPTPTPTNDEEEVSRQLPGSGAETGQQSHEDSSKE
ncbi:hypothetical protein KC367_g7344 [Hortaea werneckii]|nr:hypothetical protein KC367_g7344 [Hortaea werneckii]